LLVKVKILHFVQNDKTQFLFPAPCPLFPFSSSLHTSEPTSHASESDYSCILHLRSKHIHIENCWEDILDLRGAGFTVEAFVLQESSWLNIEHIRSYLTKCGASCFAPPSSWNFYNLSSLSTMPSITSKPPCQNSALVTSIPASASSGIGATEPPADKMRIYFGLKLSPSSW